MCCRWKKTTMTFLVESLNLGTAVNTKSSRLMCLRLRRIHLLPPSPLLTHQVRALSPLQHLQESIRKTGFPTTTIEAGRVLLRFRRIYAHALALRLARPPPPTRRCHLKKHRVCFSTNAPTDGNHGQAIIGMHPLVGFRYIWKLRGS
jgi:hypothetical protein